MILEWSEQSIADLQDIYDFVLTTSKPADANHERLLHRISGLLSWPYLGHRGRIEGTREILIWPAPYRVIYQVTEEAVRVLRVLHGKRPWPG